MAVEKTREVTVAAIVRQQLEAASQQPVISAAQPRPVELVNPALNLGPQVGTAADMEHSARREWYPYFVNQGRY